VKLRVLWFFIFGACAPNVPKNPPPNVVIVQFDPGAAIPVVPTPNDLAKDPATGRIVVPPRPDESAAQREFDVGYLGALDGFPHESTAQAVLTGDLDPSTVNARTVLAIDLGTPQMPAAMPVAITPVYANRSVIVAPPGGAWTRGHTYAIAFVAGANGLRGANGEEVVGSATWALVSSSTSLVTCADLAATDCRPTVDIIPSHETDLAKRLAEQTAIAKQLELLRRSYAPLLDGLAAKGIPRSDIPIVWTFGIIDAGEATFDPGSNVIPFPNDVLRTNGKVSLPNPKTLQPLSLADCAAAATDPLVAITCGLNTLDGFSTLAPLVSESSDALGAVAQASIDPSTLGPASVGLAPVATQAPSGEATPVRFTPCIGCASSADANGAPQTSPQQLQWRLDKPLDEKTTYVAWFTSDVKDDRGKAVIANPVFAMLRLANPLYDGTHSTVNLLTDAQARQLEPLRAAMRPILDKMEQAGIARTSLALAFAFTTQSEASVLDQLYAFPYAAALPATPLFVADVTTQVRQRAAAATIPFDAVRKVVIGAYLDPVAVTGPNGTLDPTKPQIEPVMFVLYLPASPAPMAGYPLAIFGHALTRSRNDSIALANTLALAGQATIATDALFHGERSSCTGSSAATGQASDDASCADPQKQKCNGDPLVGRCVARADSDRAACPFGTPAAELACSARAQGVCLEDGKCEGGDFLRDASGRPVISGWNLLSFSNFFATRDNLRQNVIDTSQLVRVINASGATSLQAIAGASIDPMQLGYVGQSLGSVLGALANAVSPHTTRVALNTPGGALVQLILTAPAFAAQRTALLATLASQGLQPGTPAFDRFLGIAQWILDPADPVSVGHRLTNGVDVVQGRLVYTAPNAARKTFLQFIEGDLVVPNASSFALVASANRASFSPTPPSFGCLPPLYCYQFTEAGDGFDGASVPPAARNGFLLQPAPSGAGLALTRKAQTQVATFLATGAIP
jgi:hypothetical protein